MYKIFFKRIIDILIALMALLILLPLFIPVCLILLLTGEHEVFYLQKRVGYHNAYFKIWKYVTMLKNSPSMGTGSLTLRNDPRVLPFGKFLCRSKINELPQIINVLIGNMSIVGPRPQMEVDFLKFPENIQKVIYNVKPGITGIGSIIYRDEEKLLTNSGMEPHEFYRLYLAPHKGDLEVWYQKHLNLKTDMLLIFLTAWSIIRPENNLAYKVFKDLPGLNFDNKSI